MKRYSPFVPPRPTQTTSQELLDELCRFCRVKFYAEDAVEFAKDRPRLLEWVLLYPAGWLSSRGVTLPPARYRAILEGVLMDAVRYGNTSKVSYRPAWLRMVVKSHFACHGDEYYEEGKSMRNLVDHALQVANQARGSRPDPVRELALAARLLKTKKRKSQQSRPPVNPQLTLL
jgi:hypothetical protein